MLNSYTYTSLSMDKPKTPIEVNTVNLIAFKSLTLINSKRSNGVLKLQWLSYAAEQGTRKNPIVKKCHKVYATI